MQTIQKNGHIIAVADSETVIRTAQDALDLMVNAQYLYGSDALICRRENLTGDFFDLKTRLAGEILQKFSNYGMRLAIVGDFRAIQSKALRDFIRECNRGRQVFWADTINAATALLAGEALPSL